MTDKWTTYIVNVPTQVEQKRLGELATIHTIVFAQVFTRERRGVNVECFLAVVGTCTENVGPVRDKVV